MTALGAGVVAALAWAAAVQAAECPRKGTLGTSRVLHVDAATTPRVGLKSFPQTLPLSDHEVVLTRRRYWRRWHASACTRRSS